MRIVRRWWWLLPLLVILVLGGFVIWASTPAGRCPKHWRRSSPMPRSRWRRSHGWSFRPLADNPTVGLVLYPGGTSIRVPMPRQPMRWPRRDTWSSSCPCLSTWPF